MKTVEQINTMITYSTGLHMKCQTKKEAKSIIEEITRLKNYKNFLECHPTKETLKKQLEDCEKKLNSLDGKYINWLNSTPGAKQLKNLRTTFNQECGITLLKKQINTLKFLLD